MPNSTSSVCRILKKLGTGRADFNTIENAHIEPRANILPEEEEKQRIFSEIRNTKKGAYFCDYYLFHFSLERKTRLSEGMKITSRKREKGRERGDMVKALTEKEHMYN